MSRDTTSIVGIAFVRRPHGVDPFYSEVVAGLEDVLHQRGMTVLMQTVSTPDDMVAAYVRWAQSEAVAGVMVVDLTIDDRRGAVLSELGIPHVTLGEPASGSGGAVVRVDHGTTTVHAVRKLAELGHRVIGRVSGPSELVHTQARDRAFAEATASVGGTAHTVVGDYSAASGASGALQLLELTEPPTAILFDNDVMAVAGLEALQERGLRVPDDVSMVAWDDSTVCRLATPRLSAMSHDVRELGVLAAQALLGILDGGEPADVTAPLAQFIARGTTAPLAPADPAR